MTERQNSSIKKTIVAVIAFAFVITSALAFSFTQLTANGEEEITLTTVNLTASNFSASSLTYNASDRTGDVNVSCNAAGYTGSISVQSISSTPINAGSYTVTINAASQTTVDTEYIGGTFNISLTIIPATPSITPPVNFTATCGQVLSNLNSQFPAPPVPGAFAWEQAASSAAGSVSGSPNTAFTLKFTPNDTLNYKTMTGINTSITVTQGTVFPVVTSSSTNPSAVGQEVTFTVSIGTSLSPVPTGTIQLTVNGTVIPAASGTVNSSGTATIKYKFTSAGDYQISAAYLGDANYKPATTTDLHLKQTVKASTGKSAGAAVTVPKLVKKTTKSIQVTSSVIAPNTGNQPVEYAISKSKTAPASGWQSSATFEKLTPNTVYYVFARSAANPTHSAGTPVMSAAIRTNSVSSSSGSGSGSSVIPTTGDYDGFIILLAGISALSACGAIYALRAKKSKQSK